MRIYATLYKTAMRCPSVRHSIRAVTVSYTVVRLDRDRAMIEDTATVIDRDQSRVAAESCSCKKPAIMTTSSKTAIHPLIEVVL